MSASRTLLLVASVSGAAMAGALLAALSFHAPDAVADGRRDTETVPRVIAYTGALALDGSPLTSTVGMRFSLSTAEGAVIWSEERSAALTRSCTGVADCSVSVHAGAFSVMLGQFAPLGPSVLDAEDVYLTIAVADGEDWIELSGRQRITPAPYALWTLGGTDLDVGGDLAVAQTLNVGGAAEFNGAANLRGTNTFSGPSTFTNTLTATGSTTLSTLSVTGAATVSGQLTASAVARINGELQAYGGSRFRGGFTLETSDLIFDNISGRGNGRALVAQAGDLLVVNYGNDFTGGTLVESNLETTGLLTSRSRSRVNGGAEGRHVMHPRYYMAVSANVIGNSSREIPASVLSDLCGDEDGCNVRIGMRYWGAASDTAAASRNFLFYYQPSSGRFRVSSDATGTSGNGATEHAINIWDTCYLTDTAHQNGSNLVDTTRAMHLMVWNGNPFANRECHIVIDD